MIASVAPSGDQSASRTCSIQGRAALSSVIRASVPVKSRCSSSSAPMMTASSPFDETDRNVPGSPIGSGLSAPGRSTNSRGAPPIVTALLTIVCPSGANLALVIHCGSQLLASKVMVGAVVAHQVRAASASRIIARAATTATPATRRDAARPVRLAPPCLAR